MVRIPAKMASLESQIPGEREAIAALGMPAKTRGLGKMLREKFTS